MKTYIPGLLFQKQGMDFSAHVLHERPLLYGRLDLPAFQKNREGKAIRSDYLFS